MHGFMLQCLESLVIEKYGVDKWEELKLKANCTIQTGSWVRWEYYRDAMINELVAVCEKDLGSNPLAEFGSFW